MRFGVVFVALVDLRELLPTCDLVLPPSVGTKDCSLRSDQKGMIGLSKGVFSNRMRAWDLDWSGSDEEDEDGDTKGPERLLGILLDTFEVGGGKEIEGGVSGSVSLLPRSFLLYILLRVLQAVGVAESVSLGAPEWSNLDKS